MQNLCKQHQACKVEVEILSKHHPCERTKRQLPEKPFTWYFTLGHDLYIPNWWPSKTTQKGLFNQTTLMPYTEVRWCNVKMVWPVNEIAEIVSESPGVVARRQRGVSRCRQNNEGVRQRGVKMAWPVNEIAETIWEWLLDFRPVRPTARITKYNFNRNANGGRITKPQQKYDHTVAYSVDVYPPSPKYK